MLIMHTSRIRTARSQKLLRGLSCPILEEVDPFPVSAVCSGTFTSCQRETRNISKASFNQRGRIFTLSMHVAYIEQPDFLVYSCSTWGNRTQMKSNEVYKCTQWPPGQPGTCLFWTKGSAQKTRLPRECSNAGPEDCNSRVPVWENKFNMPKRKHKSSLI